MGIVGTDGERYAVASTSVERDPVEDVYAKKGRSR